ncbi:MAG: alginate export family protein [Deltaproteobacteria bacterium]|nr:MAG: alginate export family protein [Deltaproteobacteria bacterium]
MVATALSGSVLSGAMAAEKVTEPKEVKKAVVKVVKAEKVEKKVDVVEKAVEKKEEPQKLVIGGQLRLRSENIFHQEAFKPSSPNNDANILLRARINVDAKPVDHVRVFIQPQFSRLFGQEGSTIANNSTVSASTDVIDLHQGYMDLTQIGGSAFSLRVGRQELSYGDERLIGALDWDNKGRNFDAAKLRYEKEKFWIDVFSSYNQKPGSVASGAKEVFGGIYGSHKVSQAFAYDVYALGLNDTPGTGTDLRLATFGTRLVGTLLESNQLDYNAEGAIQTGKTGGNTILAFMGHAAAGYTFDQSLKPRLGLEYNFASGDKSSTSKVERFHNLFPTNHNKYGYIDFVGLRNIHDINPSVMIKPGKATVELSYHMFLLPQTSDGLYQASGASLRSGVAGASHLAGHEADLLVKYPFNKNFSTLAGYSLFKGGKFFSDTGVNGTAHFGYLQGVASF